MPDEVMLPDAFFARNAQLVACALLGKVIRHRLGDVWLAARIIETEAYCLHDKASHAWLGQTPARRALFAAPGTIYMYYARGGDSLNFSVLGAGNAVLIKSGYPVQDAYCNAQSLARMQSLNPAAGGRVRPPDRLCAGQTLLCKSLGLKVPEWNGQRLDAQRLYLADTGVRVARIVQTTRLGIAPARDAHLPWRFVDAAYAAHCSRNPLRRGQIAGQHYRIIDAPIEYE